MKKKKRILNLLCCIVLTASMTLDVCAAEVPRPAAAESVVQTTEDESSEMLENTESVSEPEKEESEESKKENEEENKKENSESKTEAETVTEAQEIVSKTETQEETGGKASESQEETPIETETDSSAIESAESESETESETETETETETQEEENHNTNNESTDRVSVNYIFDDAFVSNFSGQNANNYKTNTTLIIGKGRHAYIRFDLSEIDADAEKIVFVGVTQKKSGFE